MFCGPKTVDVSRSEGEENINSRRSTIQYVNLIFYLVLRAERFAVVQLMMTKKKTKDCHTWINLGGKLADYSVEYSLVAECIVISALYNVYYI